MDKIEIEMKKKKRYERKTDHLRKKKEIGWKKCDANKTKGETFCIQIDKK